MGVVAVVVTLALQIYALFERTGYETPVFVVLIGVTVLAAFQTPNCRFAGGCKEPHYLWAAWPKDETPPSALEHVESQVEKLGPIVETMSKMKAAVDEYKSRG